jgi:hypothetical protein
MGADKAFRIKQLEDEIRACAVTCTFGNSISDDIPSEEIPFEEIPLEGYPSVGMRPTTYGPSGTIDTARLSNNEALAGLWFSDGLNAVLTYKNNASTDKPDVVAECEIYIEYDAYLKYQNEYFAELCKRATIDEVALHLLVYNEIDVHYDSERPFINACSNNTVDVVEYLYDSIKPDLTTNRDTAFRFACLSNKIDNAYYLMSICDRYNMKIRARITDDTAAYAGGSYDDCVIETSSIDIVPIEFSYIYDF